MDSPTLRDKRVWGIYSSFRNWRDKRWLYISECSFPEDQRLYKLAEI